MGFNVTCSPGKDATTGMVRITLLAPAEGKHALPGDEAAPRDEVG